MKAEQKAAGAGEKVPALTKAVAIIRHVNNSGVDGASLNELHEHLRLTKSHCFNILKTLVREDWLSYDESRRVYVLSPSILGDVSSALGRRPVATAMHHELVRLTREAGVPVVLTRVAADGSFIVVDTVDGPNELVFTAPLGHRFPPDAPAQFHVRLAWLEPKEREAVIAQTPRKPYTTTTIVDREALLKEAEITRQRGYGVSRAEYTPGVHSLAVPIFDSFGQIEMIVQATGFSASVIDERIAARLVAAGERLSTLLGRSRT